MEIFLWSGQQVFNIYSTIIDLLIDNFYATLMRLNKELQI
ncbi:UNVERIFIED_CONTAM: hypothetical protein ABIC26_005271 [Paenibacillus sp. PvR008]